jgi:hypothetical protein
VWTLEVSFAQAFQAYWGVEVAPQFQTVR